MTTRNIDIKLRVMGSGQDGQKALRDIEQQAKRTDQAVKDINTSMSRMGSQRMGGINASSFHRPMGGPVASAPGMPMPGLPVPGRGGAPGGAMTGPPAMNAAGISGALGGRMGGPLMAAGAIIQGAQSIQSGVMWAGEQYDKVAYLQTNRRIAESKWMHEQFNERQKSIAPMQAEVDRYNLERRILQRQSGVVGLSAPDREANIAKYGRRFADSFSDIDQARSSAEHELGREMSKKEVLSEAEAEIAQEAKKVAESLKYLQEEFDKTSNQSRDDKRREELTVEMNRLNDQRRAIQGRQQVIAEASDASSVEINRRKQELRAVEHQKLVAERDRARTIFEEARAGAIGFAAEDPSDRYDTLASLQQLQQNGFASLSARQRQMLLGNSLTQEYVGNAAAEWAKDDPVTQQILQMTGKSSLRDLEKEMQTATAKVDLNVAIDKKALEDDILDIFDKLNLPGLVLREIKAEAAAQDAKAREAAIVAGIVSRR